MKLEIPSTFHSRPALPYQKLGLTITGEEQPLYLSTSSVGDAEMAYQKLTYIPASQRRT
jgi:hypothetical protein